jgi:hypothetical protein
MIRPAPPNARGGSPRGGSFQRAAFIAIGLSAFALALPPAARAARHTPAAWSVPVAAAPGSPLEGQRKHVNWLRDKDHDFIDDVIRARSWPGNAVDVIVELNECYPEEKLSSRLGSFGAITYVGRMVSCVYLEQVAVGRLDSLAQLPEVAAVEWQTPFYPAIGVAAKATQAARSSVYGEQFVRAYDGVKWSGLTGLGVTIAVLDTGVKNGLAPVPGDGSEAGSVVGGFDASVEDDPKLDGSDPEADTDPLSAHGTRVASIALGRYARSLGALELAFLLDRCALEAPRDDRPPPAGARRSSEGCPDRHPRRHTGSGEEAHHANANTRARACAGSRSTGHESRRNTGADGRRARRARRVGKRRAGRRTRLIVPSSPFFDRLLRRLVLVERAPAVRAAHLLGVVRFHRFGEATGDDAGR